LGVFWVLANCGGLVLCLPLGLLFICIIRADVLCEDIVYLDTPDF
jgi:hypothetical protein